MTFRVAVLGCGPAGLTAVHALAHAVKGSQVHVFSKKRKSHLYGAQYLHRSLPNLRSPVASGKVQYVLEGSVEQYHDKVYGPGTNVPQVSPQALLGTHEAWDIRATYDQLWEMYSPQVTDTPLTAEGIRDMIECKLYDLVINTIPLDSLCDEGHQFKGQSIWAKGTTCATLPDEHRVVCNGERFPGWYRYSNVFGYQTWEWPEHSHPPVSGVVQWVKPISHNCTCWPWEKYKMLNVGRYGAWRKGYLTHHVYDVVMETTLRMCRVWGRPIKDPNLLGPWVK